MIIRSDAHLLPLFARSNVDAVFVSCPTRMAPGAGLRVHTDFAAWRPKNSKGAFAIHPQLSRGLLRGRPPVHEVDMQSGARGGSFQSILRSGRYALLQNKGGPCRIGGPQSAIVHQHGYVAHCVRDLRRRAQRLASVG